MRTRTAALAIVAAALASPVLGVPGSLAGTPLPQTVSIRVELDLSESSGPRVFEVTDVPVGDGPELTAADEIANPQNYCGALIVDVDNVAQTITITPDTDESCSNFETASVVVEGEGIDSLDVISDNLWENREICEMVLEASAADGVADIYWAQQPDDCGTVDMNFEGGAAVFSYGQTTTTTAVPITAPATTTTAAPTTTAPAAAVVARPAFTG